MSTGAKTHGWNILTRKLMRRADYTDNIQSHCFVLLSTQDLHFNLPSNKNTNLDAFLFIYSGGNWPFGPLNLR